MNDASSALKTEHIYLRFKFIKFIITKRRKVLVTNDGAARLCAIRGDSRPSISSKKPLR